MLFRSAKSGDCRRTAGKDGEWRGVFHRLLTKTLTKNPVASQWLPGQNEVKDPPPVVVAYDPPS